MKAKKSKKHVALVTLRVIDMFEDPIEAASVELTDSGVLYLTTMEGKKYAYPPWRWCEIEYV